ncbi:MAG TPA: GNAT family N-acetyltransferase [Acidobacteriaceae bacterium]|jgi:RimJ/RimL family protein N-acetyltransferase|nr:GNAT family N-acetyltransferase [Acidobacteriaceae bacterium]
MIIRAARPGDILDIVAIEQIPEFRSYIGSWTAEEHHRAMADPDTEYFVACSEEGTVEGFAILQGIESKHRSIHLKRIAVRTPNRGFGRLLLEHAISRAFEHHRAHRFWLDVFETNRRARRVYEAYGFRYDGVMREAILLDGQYHTLVLMSLLDREYTVRQQPGADTVTSAVRS